MAQEHAQKNAVKTEEVKADTNELHGDPQAQKESIITDELLDEIDEVLEENAQQFVNDFVQKGGE